MNRLNLLTIRAFASVLILFLSACAEEPLGGNDQKEGGHTVTLRLAASVAPIPETKASIKPANSGSKAEAAGFYYEMVSSDADRVTTTPGFGLEILPTEEDHTEINFSPKELASKAVATKAPKALKNAYALLFTSTGAFNGHAPIGVFTVGTPQDITFTKVANPKAAGCRLLIVANDDAAVTNYASTKGTGDFADFTGSYAEFQQLTITSGISRDEDVPYAGSATVDLSQSEIGVTAEVPLFWTLAKITLNNHKFDIAGGPARSSITLCNAGLRRFATPGNDNYDGTGSTNTTGFVASTAGENENSVTWYVGENIRPAGSDIKSAADRNGKKAPTNACYIRIASTALSIPKNTTPKIGEEYTQGGTKSLTYDYYLGKSSDAADFALRRHTNYTINTEISGSLTGQEELAESDGRVTLSKPESGGLVIGCFGGPSGYTSGIGKLTTISGTYTKLLLLEPNTTRSTATDNIKKIWGTDDKYQYQPESRRYWDRTYIYSITTNGTVGGMTTAADGLYAYCHELTLGEVPKGTWYVPTIAQCYAIFAVEGGMKEGNFGNYTAFLNSTYWSCTEYDTEWVLHAINSSSEPGAIWYGLKSNKTTVRCVRDADPTPASQYVTVVDGYPVIDLSELSPLGCILTPAQAATRCKEINSQTASNTAYLSVGLEKSGEGGTWNTKMSSRFQVMKTNLATESDWASAYNSCKQYEGEGGQSGQWRLPTQRELKMLCMLHPQLRKETEVSFWNTQYWTCTESRVGVTHAWRTDFYSLVTTPNLEKNQPHAVRCIKDIL